MRSRPLVLLLTLVAVLAAGLPDAEARPKHKAAKAGKVKLTPVRGALKAQIGIADQKASVFSDPRFAALGLRTARRSVGWDALHYDWQIADLDDWMAATRAAGVTPVITFARSRVDARRHLVPTPVQMRDAFVGFRARYPWVTDYVASNESNHFGEPTGRRPHLAARYYKAMKAACRTCRIAAATLLDQPNLVSWARAFMKEAKEQPRYWALHNYVSANRFDTSRTRQLLRRRRARSG